MTGIDPYTGISGGYGITTDSETNLSILYLQANAGSNDGWVNRSISEFTGRWDMCFSLDYNLSIKENNNDGF